MIPVSLGESQKWRQGSRAIAHHSEMKISWLVLLVLVLVAAAAALQGQVLQDYDYVTNADGSTITITGYTGPGGNVTIPSAINGLRVTGFGDNAFISCTNLTGVRSPTTSRASDTGPSLSAPV